MVDVFANRDPAREFGHASEMIAMPVGGDEVINLP